MLTISQELVVQAMNLTPDDIRAALVRRGGAHIPAICTAVFEGMMPDGKFVYTVHAVDEEGDVFPVVIYLQYKRTAMSREHLLYAS